jgi:ribosome biogenesis protein SSF1/2
LAVKKTKADVAAQKTLHAAKEKLKKERREEQDRNVQRKKALAGETKADAVVASREEEVDGGETSWDEEEEISEGDVSEDDDARSEDHSSEDEDNDKPPRKKRQK